MNEKIIIKLTINGNSDGISIQTARWLQGNRNQAIAAIQESFKPEIAAYSEASSQEIDTARLEALAYHEYRLKVLQAQMNLQISSTDRLDDTVQLSPFKQPAIRDLTSATDNGSSNGRSTLDLLDNL
jgi:hypothetical protein